MMTDEAGRKFDGVKRKRKTHKILKTEAHINLAVELSTARSVSEKWWNHSEGQKERNG